MPKLNVQQNNQNVIQAFKNALAIGRLKGIIASDGNHNFSTAGSNPNLLDNPFFTVRQRGNGAFTSAVYTADRWKNTGTNQSTTLTSQGLVIQQVNNGYDGVEQKLPTDLSAALVGSALTLSINCLAVSGTYRYRMRFFNGSSLISAKFGAITSAGLYFVTMDAVPANTNLIVVDFFTNSGTAGDTITVAAIKLEKGSVSTLANDAPPNYAEELAKCQYYFRRIKNTGGSNRWLLSGFMATASTGVFPLQNQMRDAGVTISYSGTLLLNGGTVTSVTAYNDAGWTTIHVGTSASFTAFGGAGLVIGSGGYIDISRDI